MSLNRNGESASNFLIPLNELQKQRVPHADFRELPGLWQTVEGPGFFGGQTGEVSGMRRGGAHPHDGRGGGDDQRADAAA